MSTKPEAIIIWSDSARGVYIPQHFAETVAEARLSGVEPSDMDILRAGPEHEEYWDAWGIVEMNACITDEHGNEYHLHAGENGDLFAVCPALMSDAEYLEFFGEPREEPRDERQAETWTITIETGNAAFDDTPECEIARILHALAEHVEESGTSRFRGLYDINGNKCGTVTID